MKDFVPGRILCKLPFFKSLEITRTYLVGMFHVKLNIMLSIAVNLREICFQVKSDLVLKH